VKLTDDPNRPRTALHTHLWETHVQNALQAAATAYTSGDIRRGDRHFHKAHPDVTVIITRSVNRILRHPAQRMHVDDAINLANLKVWQQLKNGIVPCIQQAAQHAAFDTLRRQKRHIHASMDAAHNYKNREDNGDRSNNPDGNFTIEVRVEAHDNTVVEMMTMRTLANQARQRRALWGDIIDQFINGHHQQEEIAHALGIPSGTIRRNVVEMRRVGRDQIMQDAA
jgi:DNA-directed RNA polymerase specialized sigma24 family protein